MRAGNRHTKRTFRAATPAVVHAPFDRSIDSPSFREAFGQQKVLLRWECQPQSAICASASIVSPSPLNGERAGVRAEAVRLALAFASVRGEAQRERRFFTSSLSKT